MLCEHADLGCPRLCAQGRFCPRWSIVPGPMLDFREWFRNARFPDRPWLMLGKGPSFARRHEFGLDQFNLLGLNNVASEQPVAVAHVLDIDVLSTLGDDLAERCEYLVMPRRPHVANVATERLLEDFFDEYPVLRELDSRGRLVWYNARTGAPVDDSPVIHVRHFSSEAALAILGEVGVKTVRTLGIDGGSTYSGEFSGLRPLENGRPAFDAQFRELEDIARRWGVDYDPLIEPMRVFVGTDPSQAVATRVLEWSIRKHASRPVRFVPMADLPTPEPRAPENRGRTGFSFSRFHIPKLAGYSGRALYLDADMQVFADIAELWEVPFGQSKVLCTRQDTPPPAWQENDWFHPGRQMSVMLLDCGRLGWDINDIIAGLDEGRYTYNELLFDLCIVPDEEIGDDLPVAWNHLEHYEPGVTKLLHYTVVPTQPWKSNANPLGELWQRDFEEAKDAGLVYPSELRQGVRAGYLKRELVGLPPAGRTRQATEKVFARVSSRLRQADRRFGLLRHPKIARVRSRLGRL